MHEKIALYTLYNHVMVILKHLHKKILTRFTIVAKNNYNPLYD